MYIISQFTAKVHCFFNLIQKIGELSLTPRMIVNLALIAAGLHYHDHWR
jgi:hypothetical protein